MGPSDFPLPANANLLARFFACWGRLGALTLVLVSAMGYVSPATAQETSAFLPAQGAELGALNKVTGDFEKITLDVGATLRYESVELTLRACYQSPPLEPPESIAYLDVRDVHREVFWIKPFSGWMFASSPALSSLEHPLVDLWVLRCRS